MRPNPSKLTPSVRVCSSSHRARCPLLLRLLAAARFAVLIATEAASADTLTWKDPITGSWSEGANWCCKTTGPPQNTPLPPSALDDVRINNGGTAQVSLESVTAQIVYLGQFAGQSGIVEVTGPTSQVTSATTYLSDLDTDPLTGGSGTIRLISGGKWINKSSMYIGYGGEGLVEILGGELRTPDTGFVSFDSAYTLGEMVGSVGTVRVDGLAGDALWSTKYHVTVGDRGTGNVEINNGGVAHTRNMDVGVSFESTENKVNVYGPNSRLEVEELLHLGNSGNGTLTVEARCACVNRLYDGQCGIEPEH